MQATPSAIYESCIIWKEVPVKDSPSAISPKVRLVSREAKRLYQKEEEKLIDFFEEINTSFIDKLFRPDHTDVNEDDDYVTTFLVSNNILHHNYENYEYDEIYQTHLQWWVAGIEWQRKYGKLKYARINEDWFVNNYKTKI